MEASQIKSGGEQTTEMSSALAALLTAPLLDEKELAAHLKISVPTIRRWRAASTGPKVTRLGGCVRYRMIDVVEYLNSLHQRG